MKVPSRHKVLQELIFIDFTKFSKSLEKLFCEKSRILCNHENKFLQKISIDIYRYMAFLNAFLVGLG